jgi:hypothetical protein
MDHYLLWVLFLKIANFKDTFFHCQVYALFLTKMYWATFWAIFSQTHLVTLQASRTDFRVFYVLITWVNLYSMFARFFFVQYTKTGKNRIAKKYQMDAIYTYFKWPYI